MCIRDRKKSMDLSLYWAERSKKAFGNNPHKALFGIIQGGLFNDLRLKSFNFSNSKNDSMEIFS